MDNFSEVKRIFEYNDEKPRRKKACMATTEEKSQDSVRAVDRALDILLAFQPGDEELTVAELLKRVDLSRPTLYRLLGTLEQNGFLSSSGDPQRFRLGSAVARLAHVWATGHRIADIAQPSLRHLKEATGETAALFAPEGAYRVCIAEIESAQPLSFRRGVGYREKLVRGASGRAILAWTEGDLDSLEGTKVDQNELAAIRERGYAVSRDELINGAVALAAPIFDGANRIAGSLGIFGPSVRMSAEKVGEFSQVLMREARVLSQALGQR
jgi:DNA-binding IclR family transcriptional regulator